MAFLLGVVVANSAMRGDARAQTDANKLAFVRGQDIAAATPWLITAQRTVQLAADTVGYQEQKWQDSLQALRVAYGKVTTHAAQDRLRQRFVDAQTDFARKDTVMRQHLQRLQNRLIGPVLEQIRTVIEDIRSQKGYALILDTQAQNGVVAIDKNLDITDDVIARMNRLGPPSDTLPVATPPAGKSPLGSVQKPSGVP